MLQGKQEFDNISVDIRSLLWLRTLFCCKAGTAQLLPDRLTDGLQQRPLPIHPADRAAHSLGSLPGRNGVQQLPRLPLDGRGHGEREVQPPPLIHGQNPVTFGQQGARTLWRSDIRHPESEVGKGHLWRSHGVLRGRPRHPEKWRAWPGRPDRSR